ncbi:MAG: LuxR C-terminal-related transcriptional regulator [Spirochaetota bacterium]
MVLVYHWGIKSQYRKQKLQAKTLLGVTIPLFLICSITDYLLPHFEFYKFPPFGFIGRIIYAFTIWYSFVKFRFLIPKSSLVLNEIAYNIQESVLLLNSELKIIIYNNKFIELLNLSEKNYTDDYLFDYAIENNEIKQNINKIKNGELIHCSCRLYFKNKLENVATNSNITRIIDKFGDLIGILLISNENKNIKQFQKTYRLSDRQMEIIDLSLAGFSNTEISEKLKITKKTTEAHLYNIYTKLGINNKIELYNITKKFNVIPKNDCH